MNLGEFIDTFEDAIAQRVVESYPPLYRPSENGHRLPRLLRKPLGAQADAIRGAALSLEAHRGTTVVGEMGTGKTFIAAAAAHLAGFKRVLVLCPPHLVPKWKREVVRRTRGFGTPATFPICGERGGAPRRGRSIPPGSLAEQAARYGTARYAHDGGCAAIARPVFWKGKLAKVVVIAVPEGDSAVLGPQMVASDMPGRRRRPVAAGPW